MDKKLEAIKQKALTTGASRAILNAVLEAKQYSGILDVLVIAGSYQALAGQLGVNYQAVQQWLKMGYVPLARIPEIESLYGVSRVDLLNPKYAAALAEPKFADEV